MGKNPHERPAVSTDRFATALLKEDSGAIEAVIDKLIADNPKPVEQYRSGETKVFGFFMGQANKALKGQATPNAIKEMLEKKLKG